MNDAHIFFLTRNPVGTETPILDDAILDRFVYMRFLSPREVLMNHVLSVIEQDGKVPNPADRVTAWGISVAESHFGRDKNGLLEFIVDLINRYFVRREVLGLQSNMDFDYALTEGRKIADELAIFGEKGTDLVRHYYNLGACASMIGHLDQVAGLMETALKYCGEDDSLANPILRQLEAVYTKEYGHSGPCPKLAPVLERLLDFDQINEDQDNARRFRLIAHYKATGRFKKIRETLAPLVIKIQSYDYTMFQIVCHGMADSFAQEGRPDLAAGWAASAVEKRPVEHRN